VVGWLVVGCWLADGCLLVGSWLVAGWLHCWLVVGWWLVAGWLPLAVGPLWQLVCARGKGDLLQCRGPKASQPPPCSVTCSVVAREPVNRLRRMSSLYTIYLQ